MRRKVFMPDNSISDFTDEPNDTPEGQLAKYLIGDLGVARRHVSRILLGELPASRSVLEEIRGSIARCVRRIERDMSGEIPE